MKRKMRAGYGVSRGEAFSCSALANGNYELAVALTGEWQSREMKVTDKELQQMVDNFLAEGRDLLFDFDHGCIDCFSAQGSRAAGWGKSVRIEDGRIIVEMEPTPAGKEAIENKEYRYLSPVYQYRRADKKTGKVMTDWRLHSVALTNVPFLDELPAITNEDDGFPADSGDINADEKDGKSNHGGKMDELLKLLGVTSEDEAKAEVKRLQDENAGFVKLNAAQEQQVAELKEKMNGQEVEAAIVAGKLVPAQRELATALINQDRKLYEQLISNSAALNLTKEAQLPAGEGGNGSGCNELDKVTSYAELVNNPALARKMYDERPERFSELYDAYMKGGK